MFRAGIVVCLAVLVLGTSIGVGTRTVPTQLALVPLANGTTILVSRHEVTVADWRVCFENGGCSHLPVVPSAPPDMPVTGLNWFDVGEYIAWVKRASGADLRLPTIEEWRVIARSLPHKPETLLFTDPRLAWAATYGQDIPPPGPPRKSGSFTTTAEGVADLDGNVWEWTSSCAAPGFTGSDADRCPAYVAAGAHEATVPVFIRDPSAGGCTTGTPPSHLGFRLVSDG